MREKIDLDKIETATERAIAGLAQLSRRRTYGFACEDWVFRMVQSVSEKGELVGKTFYEFSCVNHELWRAPKFTCTIQILEHDSLIHTGEHPEPCCGTLNLDYQPNPTDSDPEAKHGHFVALLVMPSDRFAKLHLCLAHHQLRPTISIVMYDSLSEWEGKQVYCEQYTIGFRPQEAGEGWSQRLEEMEARFTRLLGKITTDRPAATDDEQRRTASEIDLSHWWQDEMAFLIGKVNVEIAKKLEEINETVKRGIDGVANSLLLRSSKRANWGTVIIVLLLIVLILKR